MKHINAEIITISDEILYGQIVDTNSQWICSHLDELGIKIVRKVTVGDVESHIMESLASAEKEADLILITVQEFSDVPVICKRDADTVLRKGACYVRTFGQNQTVELPSQTEMREILSLAIEKSLARMLASVARAGGMIVPISERAPELTAAKEQFDAQRDDL